MNKILFAFVFAILLMSSVSALGTIHTYREDTKTATIYDWIGIDKIADIQLIENTDFCLKKCHAIIKITPYNDIQANDAQSYKFDFIDKNGVNSLNKINKLNTYKKVYENYTDYENIYGTCTESYWNENISQNVNHEYSCITGTNPIIKTREKWEVFHLTPAFFKKLDGPVYIKIEAEKDPLTEIDWIPKFYGESIEEMAWWAGADSKIQLTINTFGQILDSNTTIFASVNTTNTTKFGAGCSHTFMVYNDVTEIDRDIINCGISNSSVRFKIQGNINGSALTNYSVYIKAIATNTQNNSKLVYWSADDFTEASFNRTYWNITAQSACTNPTPLQGGGRVNLTGGTRCYWGLNMTGAVTAPVRIDFAAVLTSPGVNQYHIGLSNNSQWSATEALPGGLGYPAIMYTRSGGGSPNMRVGNVTSTNSNNTATEDNFLRNYSMTLYSNASAYFSFENGTTYSINSFVPRNDTPMAMFIGSANLGVTEQIDYIKVYKTDFPITVSVGAEETPEVSFNQYVLIGSLQRFFYNTTTSGTVINNIILTWNNTNYTTSLYDFGGNKYGSIRDLIIPSIGNSALINLTWTEFHNNGNNITSGIFQQQVVGIFADNCTNNTLLMLNYTLRDEITQTIINATPLGNTTMEIQVDFSSQGGTLISTFNQSYSFINPARVCVQSEILNATNVTINTLVRYSSIDRVTELHNIQNRTVSNNSIPININLYDLTSADSQEFKINVKDQYYLPYPNVLIDITRKYIAEGVSKSVEIPKTDIDGNAIGHFDLNAVLYTLIVTSQGQILKVLNDVQPICTNQLTGDCTININLFSTTSSTTNFATYKGINYNLNFNESNRRWISVFTTTDGSTATMLLNVTRFDQFGNTSLCSSTVTTSGGTIFCDVPVGFGNVTTIATLYGNNEYLTSAMASITQSAAQGYGNVRIILIALMFITLSMMFLSSPIMTIMAPIIGLGFATMLNLMDGSIFGATSTILYLVIAGGIILYKMTRRE